MRRFLPVTVAALLAGVFVFAWISRPLPFVAADLPGHDADASRGERFFNAGGCASCHATPVNGKRARGVARLNLGGGLELDTRFGVFRVPNISTDPQDGIGSWTMLDFVNAMQRGVSPDGRHYYPSFPYTSYARMQIGDVMDLKAYLDTLPAIPGSVEPHALAFPYSFRRGLGFWKRRYLDTAPVVAVEDDPQIELGRELVEGAGHCGECHTPRDRFGGLDAQRWLGGAPNLDGDGRIPNITSAGKSLGDWSAGDIAYYLESGFTPDFDTVGGSMVAVQENLAKLPPADLAAIAAYLKAVPGVE